MRGNFSTDFQGRDKRIAAHYETNANNRAKKIKRRPDRQVLTTIETRSRVIYITNYIINYCVSYINDASLISDFHVICY